MELPCPKTQLVIVVVLFAFSAALSQHFEQFVAYDRFNKLLSSSPLSARIDYVEMSHPDFEFFSCWCDKRVLSVKLSENQLEKWVVVPNSEWSHVIEALNSREIPVIAVD